MNAIKNRLTSLTQIKLIHLSKKKWNKVSLLKNMIKGKKNVAGKNSLGKITVYHRGGGHKKKYRKINFRRIKDSTGVVTSLEYDPFRTALIASIYDFGNFKYFYIIAPKYLNIGSIIKSGTNAEIKVGHCLTLTKIPIGILIHNISLKKNKRAQFARSAGVSAQLIETAPKYCRIRLSSGIHKLISSSGQATIGAVSNKFSFLRIKNKAGRSRWLNKRPTVRGVAMNPIDHPHGGGEGKSSGGQSSVTPWGKPIKNNKKRSKKNSDITK